MSVSLIGWFAKGPLHLSVSERHQAQLVSQLARIADWWQGLGEDAEADYADHVNECPVPIVPWLVDHEDSFFFLIQWLTEPVENEITPLTCAERIAVRLQQLLVWPPENATIAWTEDPDDPSQVLVFAGDLSHGDEPDSPGYRHLHLLALTGVGAAVGIKLIDPCITLKVTN